MNKFFPSPHTLASEPGFTTLISVLLITAIIIGSLLSLNFAMLTGRYISGSSGSKRASSQLALGCADYALLQYALDRNYPGHEQVNIAHSSCRIGGINQTEADSLIIATSAVTDQSASELNTQARLKDLSITSQAETSSSLE